MSAVNKKLLQVYDSEVGRELVVLSYLSRSEDFVSIKEIAQKTGLTPISVQKHLEKINVIIEDLGEQDMGILVTEAGVQFYTATIQQYYRLRNHLIHSSVGVQLGLKLLVGNEIHRESFLMTHFISEATFKRRIKELKHFFLEYNLNLKARNGAYIIKGDEAQIRKVAYESLVDLHLEGSWPFETIDEDVVIARVESYFGMTESDENAGFFRKAKLDYGIMISRFRNHHHLKFDFSRIEKNLYDLLIQIVSKIPQTSELPVEHSVSFLATLLSDERFYATPNGQKILALLQKSNSQLAELVTYSARTFSKSFDLQTDYVKMEPSLYSIHFEKLFYHYWRGAMHKKSLITPCPMLNRKCIQYILDLRKAYPQILTGTLYLLTRKYVVFYGRYQHFSFYELPIHVYLGDGDFPYQAETVAHICQAMFSSKYNLVFSSLAEADLRIQPTSALPPPRLSKQKESIPTYYLNLSRPYRKFLRLDEMFQEAANQKILEYNRQVYQKFLNSNN